MLHYTESYGKHKRINYIRLQQPHPLYYSPPLYSNQQPYPPHNHDLRPHHQHSPYAAPHYQQQQQQPQQQQLGQLTSSDLAQQQSNPSASATQTTTSSSKTVTPFTSLDRRLSDDCAQTVARVAATDADMPVALDLQPRDSKVRMCVSMFDVM